MVFFTCSSCGDSLKKNAVEKHFSSRCISAQYVTCIDCSKDFWGNDYNNHTSCMTEDEKYGSSGQVVKELKGKKKQQQWIQNLKLYLENYKNLDSNLQIVIQNIIKYDNIPQKEKKFKNFLVNSLHLNPKMIDKAWEIFQGALKSSPKIDNKSENDIIQLENASSNDTPEKIADTTNENGNVLEKSLKKKKNKKRKFDDEEENDEDHALHGRSSAKKLKNKPELEGTSDTISSEIAVVLQDALKAEENDKTSKKKRNKKNKNCQEQKYSPNEESCDVYNHNNGDAPTLTKNKNCDQSTSKSKKENTPAMDVDQNMEDEATSKKKKKGKRSVSEMEDVTEEKQNITSSDKILYETNGTNESSRRTKKKLKLESIKGDVPKKEFKWGDVVRLALESMDGVLKIKKLEKMVVPKLLETKLVLSEDEARRLFKEHISSSLYVINGNMIQLK